MANFIKILLRNPKGNGIVRQVRRAEHEAAVEKVKKAGEVLGGSAAITIATPLGSHFLFGSASAAPVAGGVFGYNWFALCRKGALNSIREAVNNCKNLKASEEYKAIVDRAKKIKTKD